MHGCGDASGVVLHTLKAYVDREVSSTVLAVGLLNVAMLVVPRTILDELEGLAEDTSADVSYRFNDSCLDLSPQGVTNLNGPDVLALDASIDVVWA